MHKHTATEAQPTSRAKRNRGRQTEYSKAGKRQRQTRQTGQTRISKQNHPTPQPRQPMWKVGPKAHREQGDDACMGLMGLLGMGVHMHQVG